MSTLNVLIVAGNVYPDVVKLMVDGAVAKLRSCEDADVAHEVISVPGSFEIPTAMSFAILSDREQFDGYVALGCILKGATDHHHHIAAPVFSSLSEIAAHHAVAMGLGIITADNMDLAMERADMKRMDIGGQAATAVLRMIKLYKRFLG